VPDGIRTAKGFRVGDLALGSASAQLLGPSLGPGQAIFDRTADNQFALHGLWPIAIDCQNRHGLGVLACRRRRFPLGMLDGGET
jgi:hypothetical protein